MVSAPPPLLTAAIWYQVSADQTAWVVFTLLINSSYPMADEVVGACLRVAAPAHPDPNAFLLRAGKTLAAELAGDLPRLNAVLRKLMP